MKKLMMIAVVMGAMGVSGIASAAGDTASATFTWSGAVPASPSSDGWIIKDSVGNDIQRGALIYKLGVDGKGELTSSSTIDFNVFKSADGVEVGDPAAQYSFALTSLQSTKGGLPQEQDSSGYYAVVADGTPMVKGGTPIAKTTGGVTFLTVASSGVATPSNQPVAGEDVDVHARIVVTGAL